MPTTVRVTVPKKPNPKLASVLAEPIGIVNTACRVGVYIAEHPNGADIEKAIKNPKWSLNQLSTVLKGFGIVLAPSTISDHRRSRCICDRATYKKNQRRRATK